MQEVRSWVSSPLAQHVLLDMFKDSGTMFNHFLNKYVSLKKKPEFKTSSKSFVAANSDLHLHLKSEQDVNKVECPQAAALDWVKKNTHLDTDGAKKNIPHNAQLVLLNVSSFESPWARDNGSSLMKIYNSFSYTQDVSYEARILEMPLRDEAFKMVVIAPNDVDLLHTLFRRLSRDGLQAAICNLQPLFTSEQKLLPPVMHFNSEESYEEKLAKVGTVTISQYGNTNISETGAQFSVLSYLYVRCFEKTPTPPEVPSVKEQPFFFGLVYYDTPIFTGQFNSVHYKS